MVDADAYLAGIYARKFEQDGWTVLVSETFSGIKKAVGRKQPSAVILEPDEDAEAAEKTIAQLRAEPKTSTIPILILTTIAEKTEIERMKRAGASAYLIKGHFVPNEVVKKVKGMIS